MRRFAIATSGGACLMLAAAVACGSTTAPASNSDKPTAKPTPTIAKASGAWSDESGRTYGKWHRQAHNTQVQSPVAECPANYGREHLRPLQHPEDWDRGAYLYTQYWSDNSFRQSDLKSPYRDYGATQYRTAWKYRDQDRITELRPQERGQLVRALARLNESERQQLVDRFREMDRSERQRLRNLFGFGDGSQQYQYEARAYQGQGRAKFENCSKTGSGKSYVGGTKYRRTQPRAQASCLTGNKAPDVRKRAGWGQKERQFFQMLAQALQDEQNDSLAAVKTARENLTPQQRLQLFEPLLAEPGGSQEMRNAAYLILIETYRDMDNLKRSMELAQAMISESQQ